MKRTPFREKDQIFTKMTQETGNRQDFINYFIVFKYIVIKSIILELLYKEI